MSSKTLRKNAKMTAKYYFFYFLLTSKKICGILIWLTNSARCIRRDIEAECKPSAASGGRSEDCSAQRSKGYKFPKGNAESFRAPQAGHNELESRETSVKKYEA